MIEPRATDRAPAGEAFLSVLSHELRTPITTIYAGSSVLAREADLSAPATRILAHDISVEAARLYDLVEDLLVLARIERGILDPLVEPVLVQRAVDATIRAAIQLDDGTEIVRTGDPDPPPVRGDATYVQQACRDLIGSSVREAFPTPGGSLVVDVRADERRQEVSVRVLDGRQTVDPNQLERAFELPPSTSSGRSTGAGLGPFVCRQLVEAMGGRTWAVRPPEGGTELGFALPMLDATG